MHDGPGIRTTVFLKGCPLRCRWCSNAESMSPESEVGIIRDRCDKCGKCRIICPEGAISLDNIGSIIINRAGCISCGDCVSVCPREALTIYGRQITVDEVFSEVGRDRSFYGGSGGGVTVSGGEPLRQAEFVAALFRRCKEAGMSTCLDTCGYAPVDTLKRVLDHTDNVLYDIKHMDSERHRELTGVPNDLILKNARIVAERGIPVLFRIPLIKAVNDTADNIEATARFVKSLGGSAAVELLPYHRLGIGKYPTLDQDYPGKSFSRPSPRELESVIQIFQECGVPCTAGG